MAASDVLGPYFGNLNPHILNLPNRRGAQVSEHPLQRGHGRLVERRTRGQHAWRRSACHEELGVEHEPQQALNATGLLVGTMLN